MRLRVLGLTAAVLAFFAAPAAASDATTCVDVTIIFRPGPGVAAGPPYSCDCGPAVTTRPTTGGIVITYNAGCIQ